MAEKTAIDSPTEAATCISMNQWFLSLEVERQAILKEDKWMLAEAAFQAGVGVGVSLVGAGDRGSTEPKSLVVDYKYGEDPVKTKLFDFDTEQTQAQDFCRHVKRNGGAVNIKTR